MTDTQMMTLALSLIIPLSMLLYSNNRISEAKETLRAETRALGSDLRTEMAGLRAEMAAGFARIETSIERLEAKLVIHELEHHRK
jgi:hypothetical protein